VCYNSHAGFIIIYILTVVNIISLNYLMSAFMIIKFNDIYVKEFKQFCW
jgi:hypothetical protein